MVDCLGVHALDHAHVVDALGQMRQGIAQPRARLAVLRKLQRAGCTWERFLAGRHRRLALGRVNGFRHLFAEALGQVRFVVEKVELRRAAGLKKINNPLGLRRKVGQVVQAINGIALGRLAVEQRTQRHRT